MRAFPGDKVASSLGLLHIAEEMCEIYQCRAAEELFSAAAGRLCEEACCAALPQVAGGKTRHDMIRPQNFCF